MTYSGCDMEEDPFARTLSTYGCSHSSLSSLSAKHGSHTSKSHGRHVQDATLVESTLE